MNNELLTEEKIISEEVDAFINKHIHSIMHLEILLMFYRSQHQEFGVKIIQEQLHLSTERVEKILSELFADKFISVRRFDSFTSYYYQPNDKKHIIDSLNKTFIKHRSEMIKIILAKM